MARLVRAYRRILSIAIAQTQTEQASSPSMTAFTTQWACRNSAISETSVDASGKADCATSAGFMSSILSTQGVPYPAGSENRLPVPQPRVRRGDKRQRESLSSVAWGARPKPGLCFPCQHVKTRAIRAPFRP